MLRAHPPDLSTHQLSILQVHTVRHWSRRSAACIDTIHADKYQDKAQSLHAYGQYLISCLPKYIQQYVYRAAEEVGK
jgi:hypothetical protein